MLGVGLDAAHEALFVLLQGHQLHGGTFLGVVPQGVVVHAVLQPASDELLLRGL